MSAILKMFTMPTVPTFVMVAARNVLPAVRRLPGTGPMSRYRFDVPTITFDPRDLGM